MHSGVPLFSSVTAFSTIAWDDLEEGASSMRQERDSLGCQVREKTEMFFKKMDISFVTSPRKRYSLNVAM